MTDSESTALDPSETQEGEGLAELQDAYNAWTEGLGKYSTEATYAIIAANWAVYATAGSILDNTWAKWSIAVAILFLGVQILVIGVMCFLHSRQYKSAVKDPTRWKGKDSWPYPKLVECLRPVLPLLRMIVPFVAALLFLVGLFCDSTK